MLKYQIRSKILKKMIEPNLDDILSEDQIIERTAHEFKIQIDLYSNENVIVFGKTNNKEKRLRLERNGENNYSVLGLGINSIQIFMTD